jgi:predicted O-methyltransferase YrrM
MLKPNLAGGTMQSKLRHTEAQDPRFLQFRSRILGGFTVSIVLTAFMAALNMPLALWLLSAIFSISGLILYAILTLYHRTQIESFQHYRQQESLLNLHAIIHPRRALPPMRLWAASPDFLVPLAEAIHTHKPQHIVELGSGTSTLISAYCLEQIGIGKITSLDHDATFAQATRDLLITHGLTSWADVIHAPLVEGWYTLPELQKIDLLIVDGPPARHGEHSRYPALPRLINALNPNALIIVDDYMRHTEFESVQRWLTEFNLQVVSAIPNEKGLIILRVV